MKGMLLFPLPPGNDNRIPLAFTIELARHLNADILILASLGIRHRVDAAETEGQVRGHSNAIHCELLSIKGYYQGRYNRWMSFEGGKIRARTCRDNLNTAISGIMQSHADLSLVLQVDHFTGIGLYEELLANPTLKPTTTFLLPRNLCFPPPPPGLTGALFNRQKRDNFFRSLSQTTILNLPQDMEQFRLNMMFRQAG